jgi:hypothetical protein
MFHSCQLWHPPKDCRIFSSHEIFRVGTSLCYWHMPKKFKSKRPKKRKWHSKSTNKCSCEKQRGESFPKDWRIIILCVSLGLENFHTCDQHHKDHVTKISCWNNRFSALVGRLSKLERLSPLFLTTTPVGRFGISFFCESFGLEFFHMCKQHKYVSTLKLSCEFFFSEFLGGCQSWQLWNISYNYPLLVNIEYLFYYQSSSFEIWYTCCQPNNNFVPKI